MRYNKNGISLISLIITVLIISIIASVIIPGGIDKINNAKLTTFNDNIMVINQEVNNYFMQNDEYPAKVDESGNPLIYSITENALLAAEANRKNDQSDVFYIIDLDKLKLDNKDLGVGKTIDDYYILARTSGNVYYAKGSKIGNITYYTKQSKGDGVVATVPTTAPAPNGSFDGRVNSPKLSSGMTAVKWNGSAWVNADTSNVNNDWYDYTQGINKWANVKLADDSLLVWIPRYTYKIISGEHTSTAGTIDIKFSTGIKDDTLGAYRIHPAFYWGGWNIPASTPMTKESGGAEITGIWVGKFESSNSGGKIKIISNATSWSTMTVDGIFTACRAMQTTNSATYGISTDSNMIDTHMLKNSEWGAVAYLSKYALGTGKISINSNSSYITADGDIVMNKTQSTTGNEYGIYDMNGCKYEYVASYINNGDTNLTTYGNSLILAQNKYKDIFPKGITDSSIDNYEASSKAYGYALYETSNGGEGGYGWYGESIYYPSSGDAFFYRGTTIHLDPNMSGLFNTSGGEGTAVSGFRVACVVP